jgi:flagellar biosynthesis/type III secretory pathway M-ring protein FliF/YscJ
MPSDFASTLFVVFCFALTFVVARTLSRGFRAKRKEKEDARREAERRATETRQVRRARERRAK